MLGASHGGVFFLLERDSGHTGVFPGPVSATVAVADLARRRPHRTHQCLPASYAINPPHLQLQLRHRRRPRISRRQLGARCRPRALPPQSSCAAAAGLTRRSRRPRAPLA
ncbi:hypothetical protein PVAP13_4KG106400 [Panicum virgatum]|uniref:Uncharacterized protein n=1 Tax=Panicum virgatum TaxID=38727 RepID=A0A8T0TL04_PANVG|nr:hypothetical protein PVAP13_4KG106400 [Panicum virgatum]